MPQCAGIKRDGGRCTTIVNPPLTYCYQHDPERAEERSRNNARAAKGGTKEIRTLKRKIQETVEGVLDGSVDRSKGAVAIQGYNAWRAVLELERKVRELDELEERIAALEGESADHPARGARWGA
jgi:hypothetical protein